MGCDRHTVGLWRARFVEHGLPGLQDAPRPGRPPRVSPRAARHRRRPGLTTA
jgi:transposase